MTMLDLLVTLVAILWLERLIAKERTRISKARNELQSRRRQWDATP